MASKIIGGLGGLLGIGAKKKADAPTAAAASAATKGPIITQLGGSTLDDLYDDLARFTHDPLGFVLWAFPWGEPGTSLEHEHGPELEREIEPREHRVDHRHRGGVVVHGTRGDQPRPHHHFVAPRLPSINPR